MREISTEAQPIGALIGSRKTTRDQAVRVARNLECCNAVQIPRQPAELRNIECATIAEWRSSGPRNDFDRSLLIAWNEWAVARSSAIHENISRLRGLLWCYRTLARCSQDDASDREAADFYELVRDFLAQVWHIPNPPLDRVMCSALAGQVVYGLLEGAR